MTAVDRIIFMALKVVHIIKRETIAQEAEARAFWEDVLKPKWEAEARIKAEKLFAKHYPNFRPEQTTGNSA